MAKQTKMGQLFNTLEKTLKGLDDESIKSCDAREIANLAGKMINSAKTEIEYAYAKQKLGTAISIAACE